MFPVENFPSAIEIFALQEITAVQEMCVWYILWKYSQDFDSLKQMPILNWMF